MLAVCSNSLFINGPWLLGRKKVPKETVRSVRIRLVRVARKISPAEWPKQIGLVLGKCKHEIKALIN